MTDAAAEDPHPSSSILGTAIGVAAFVVVVALFLSTYDALAEGDGAVSVTSETLQVEALQPAGGPSATLVAYTPGATMSIGLPIRNRGLVPVTITDIEAVERAAAEAADADHPCQWEVTRASTTRERSMLAGGESFSPVRIASRANAQLFVGAAFPDGDCLVEGGRSSRDTLVLSYRLLGLVPRRQEIPMLPITTTYDQDDAPGQP